MIHPLRLTLATAMLWLPLYASAQVAERTEHWNYTVAKGDSLIKFGKRFMKVPAEWAKLQEFNALKNPNLLVPGSVLRIPVAWLRSDATVATVVSAQGTVAAVRGAQRIDASPNGTQLLPGDRIETGAQSTLTVDFADGSRVVIAPQSKVLLESLLAYGKTGITETRLKIDEGGVDSQVKPMAVSASRYVVTTPVFNLGVRGTDFRARFDPLTRTAFSEVLEGAVAAGAGAAQVKVDAGFGTLALVNTPPKSPKLLLPAPQLRAFTPEALRVPVSLNWQAEAGASGYRAQVFTDRTLSRQLMEGVFAQPQANWPTLEDGAYVLRVRSIDAEGLEGASAVADFAVRARPFPPPLSQPAPRSRVYGPNATFKWSALPQAERYRLQVSESANFTTTVLDNPYLRPTELELPLQVGTYFWRVATIERGGKQGPFGEAVSFVQRAIPTSPLLPAPRVDADGVRYQWQARSQGERFQYQLSAEPQFLAPLVDVTTSEPVANLPQAAAGTYYFRVKTIDADGYAGPFGSIQTFEIARGKK